VIGGLICSTMLTFLVLPVLYEIVSWRTKTDLPPQEAAG